MRWFASRPFFCNLNCENALSRPVSVAGGGVYGCEVGTKVSRNFSTSCGRKCILSYSAVCQPVWDQSVLFNELFE